MKSFLSILFAIMLTTQAWAQITFEVGNLKYTVTDKANCYVSVCKGTTSPTGALTIPSTVKNGNTPYTVTSIDNNAFEYCYDLTSITIPNSVTSIGNSAFYGCSNLTSITIGSGVTSIGKSAFSACSKLANISVDSGNTNYSSEDGVLFNFNRTTLLCYLGGKTGASYTIPNLVTSIDGGAFSYCSRLSSITIPNSVTSIDGDAFYNCPNLTTLNIESNADFSDAYLYFTQDNFIYHVLNKDSVEIVSNPFPWAWMVVSYSGDIVIPSAVTAGNTFAVKRISDGVFQNCTNLTSVIIGNSVTDIGSYAFSGCSGLMSVNILNTVTCVGNEAFAGCSKLTSISIPSSVESIGNKAFKNCNNFQEIVFKGETPPKFGADVFYNTNNCPIYVPVMAFGAYKGATNMSSYSNRVQAKPVEVNGILYKMQIDGTFAVVANNYSGEVVIPSSINFNGNVVAVTTISSSAFNGCIGLTSITISESITSIGGNAFVGCNNLINIRVKNGNTNFSSEGGVLFNHNKTTLILYPIGKTGTYAIPNSVTSIGGSAFSGCNGLTSITVPNSVTTIGGSAFQNCSGLTSVTIPNSVTSIGQSAFSGCNSLTSITLPFVGDKPHKQTDTYQYPMGYIFGTSNYMGSTKTTQYYYGSNINNTQYYSSYIPSSLKFVTITGNSYIPYGAFSNCSDLIMVTVDNSVTSIGKSAFSGCVSLTSVTIGNSVTGIGNNAFSGCNGLTSVTIGNSAKRIGDNAFSGCNSLASVCIPDSVTSIGNNAFSGCNGLTSITIGNSVTDVGHEAFYGCSGLTSITIPNSVTNIGNNAFSGCSGLTSVCIPKSVTSIGNNAFFGCDSLTSVTTDCAIIGRANLHFTKDNIRYRVLNKNDIEVVSNNNSDSYSGEIIIPATVVAGNSFWVKSINSDAFNNCKNLTSVTIPNSAISIGNSAFRNCSGLTSVIIGNSVNRIGDDAFSGCSSLTSVCIPDSVTSIGNSTFSSCSGLTTVTIPKSVTSIGGTAFENCSGLTSIVIPNTVTSIGAAAFKDCVNLTIYCQAKVKHTGWSNEWNINECPVVWGAQLVNVNVAANNSVYGQVSGMGAYTDGSQATILAIANVGYVFVKWSDDNTENPRTIVANGDLDFTAIFEKTNELEESNTQEGENQGGENTNSGTAVAESAAGAINIYAHGNTIVVENATEEIRVYNAMGALVGRDVACRVRAELQVNGAGVYIVKVGNVAKRVMIND